MNALIIVYAHGKEQSCYDRHAPFWLAHGLPVWTVIPEDDFLKSCGELFLHGAAGRAGQVSRHRMIMRRALEVDGIEWFLFHEYDSLCLSFSLPPFETLGPIAFANVKPESDMKRWQCSEYYHLPWAIQRQALTNLADAADKLPDTAEEGHSDRWLALVAKNAGVHVSDWRHWGHSMNTLEGELLPDAFAAVRRGAVMVHGIKSAETLSLLLWAKNNR